MQEIRRYQVRGIPGEVNRVSIKGRFVDYWAPQGGSDHILIAHDGQNIFDRKTATFIHTWRLAQSSIRIANEFKRRPPLIIGVFHGATKKDPHGRAKDLCPEEPFRDGMMPTSNPLFGVNELRGDDYLITIFDDIVPAIVDATNSDSSPEKTAMLGSSMGGLATLYAAIKHHDRFNTALALSPHWVLAGNQLVDWMIPRLPNNEKFRIWMSRGTKGLDALYKPFQERADQIMSERGWDNQRYISKVFHRTSHNERSWASYVDQPLRFWMGGI